jgi:hypothetical protein
MPRMPRARRRASASPSLRIRAIPLLQRGNAWLSSHEGESWRVISHCLPPVLCVPVVG